MRVYRLCATGASERTSYVALHASNTSPCKERGKPAVGDFCDAVPLRDWVLALLERLGVPPSARERVHVDALEQLRASVVLRVIRGP